MNQQSGNPNEPARGQNRACLFVNLNGNGAPDARSFSLFRLRRIDSRAFQVEKMKIVGTIRAVSLRARFEDLSGIKFNLKL